MKAQSLNGGMKLSVSGITSNSNDSRTFIISGKNQHGKKVKETIVLHGSEDVISKNSSAEEIYKKDTK